MSESDNERIGQRLSELRKTLSIDTGEQWSQERLAKQLQITPNAVHRWEKGTGASDTLIKIILFYHHKGFNILWIISPDNSGIPKYHTLDNQTTDTESAKALEMFKIIKALIKD